MKRWFQRVFSAVNQAFSRLSEGGKIVALVIVLLFVGWGLATTVRTATSSGDPAEAKPTVVSYSQLLRTAQEKKILRAEANLERGEVVARLRDHKRIAATVPPGAAIVDQLAKRNVDVRIAPPIPDMPDAKPVWQTILMFIVVFFVVFIVINALFKLLFPSSPGRTAVAGGGKGKGAVEPATVPSERFTDVAGVDEAVLEVREFVDFLKAPERFRRVGAQMPSGLLLYGPPGTGKTLLARALAGEAGVPFYATSGSSFVEMYVGVGASRVRALFEKARAHPEGAIIFIDEIDALGKARQGGSGSHDEREQTLNELLVAMDGFDQNSRIVVIGATNRKDVLDPALLRPGRLSRHVAVPLPSKDGRRSILKHHASSRPLAEDVSLTELAEITAGRSGADLKNLINEAAIMAARAGRDALTMADLHEGFLCAIAGPERASSPLADGEREVIAAHEAGHVLCAELCPGHEKATRTTIKARGSAAGLAIYGAHDRALHNPEHLHAQLICVLGGRAAEFVRFGRVSSGAANDLQVANAIARQAVEELGFSPRTGQLLTAAGPISDARRARVDEEVDAMVTHAYTEALRLLRANEDALIRLETALLEQEDLLREDILAALQGETGQPIAEVPLQPWANGPEDPSREQTEHAHPTAVAAPGRHVRPRLSQPTAVALAKEAVDMRNVDATREGHDVPPER